MIACRRIAGLALLLLLTVGGSLGTLPARAVTVTGTNHMALCGVSGAFQLPDGSTLRVRLALDDEDKKRGLSGFRETDFAEDEALLMVGFNNNQRSINMGDTFFNIDVFFLDDDLKVVGLQRNLKAHPGRVEPPAIENSEWVFARHIMEMRSGSSYANRIQQGMVLRWQSQPTIKDIERCMANVWNRANQR